MNNNNYNNNNNNNNNDNKNNNYNKSNQINEDGNPTWNPKTAIRLHHIFMPPETCLTTGCPTKHDSWYK